MANLENRITLDSSQYEEAAKRVNETTKEAILLQNEAKKTIDNVVYFRREEIEASKALIATNQDLSQSSSIINNAINHQAESIGALSSKMSGIGDLYLSIKNSGSELLQSSINLTESSNFRVMSIEAEKNALEALKKVAEDNLVSKRTLKNAYIQANAEIIKLVSSSGKVIASMDAQDASVRNNDASLKQINNSTKALNSSLGEMASAISSAFTTPSIQKAIVDIDSLGSAIEKHIEKTKELASNPVDLSWIDEVNAKSAIEHQKTREAQAKQREETEKLAAELKALIPTQELVDYSTKAMGVSSQEYHENLKKLQAQAKDAGWSMDALAEGFISASEGQYKLITMNGVSMAETAKLTTSSRAYGLTLEEQEQRTNKLRDAAYRNGATMNELSSTYLKVTDNSYKLVDANGQVYASLEKNIKGTKAATDAQKAFIRHQDELKANLTKIASLTAVAFSFRELGRAADEMADFSNKVKNATGTLKEFAESKQAVIDIAANAGQELKLVGDMFYNVRANIDRMNISQKDALTVTDVFSKALVVSGASAQETGAAFNQLEKAFATGKLSAEGLNAVLQHAPVVAKSLADSLGVPIDSLRDMARQGKLTSEVLAKSAIESQDAIEGMFRQTEATISGSMNTLKTRFKEWVDGANGATGASQKLAKAINFVADNIDILATSAAAFIAVKMTLSIIKTTIEVVNFGKSILVTNTAQKKGIANNIAYAKSLDAVGLSAKKATADINRMNAAQAVSKSGPITSAIATAAGSGGARAVAANAGRFAAGAAAGGSEVLVVLTAALASLASIESAVKLAQGKEASNFISRPVNKMLGYDNETASMGTALFDFTEEVRKNGSLLDTVTRKMSENLLNKVDEFKKIDFWKEVTKYLTGNNGEYKPAEKPADPAPVQLDADRKITESIEKTIDGLSRINETFGLTDRQIRKMDFDNAVEKWKDIVANSATLDKKIVESAELSLKNVNAKRRELLEQEAIIASSKELARSQEEAKSRMAAVDDVITGLIKQKHTLGMSADALVRFEAAANGATEEQQKLIVAHQNLISEYEKDAKAKQTIANLKDQEQLADKSDMYKRVWQESKNGASRQQLVEIQRLLNNISEKSGNKWESVDITEIMRKTGNSNFNGFSGINSNDKDKKLEEQAKDMGKIELKLDLNGKTISGAVLADPDFIKQLDGITKDSMNIFLNQEAKKVKN